MAEPVYALGNVAFSQADVPMSGERRSTVWRWARTQVVGAAPRLSYVGPGEDTIKLSGVVFPGQLGAVDAVDQLRALGDAGTPHTLATGSGLLLGQWVVTGLEEEPRAHLPGGGALARSWSLSLERFPDD